jgi:hypothetical protein
LKSLPVPEVTEPTLSQAQRVLASKLASAEEAIKSLRVELKAATDRSTQAEELTAKVRAAAAEAQTSSIQRLHVVTLGIPKVVPNTPRFHALEDNGVACVPNWGPAANEFAAKVCGAGNYAMDSMVSVNGGPCGQTVAAFMCKAPIP